MSEFLCLACSNTADLAEEDILDACPNCGDDRGVPADLDESVTITITWHELRILTIWSEMWAGAAQKTNPAMQKVLYGIADRIQAQCLDKERPPLTFQGEITQLRERFGSDVVEIEGFNEYEPEGG